MRKFLGTVGSSEMLCRRATLEKEGCFKYLGWFSQSQISSRRLTRLWLRHWETEICDGQGPTSFTSILFSIRLSQIFFGRSRKEQSASSHGFSHCFIPAFEFKMCKKDCYIAHCYIELLAGVSLALRCRLPPLHRCITGWWIAQQLRHK